MPSTVRLMCIPMASLAVVSSFDNYQLTRHSSFLFFFNAPATTEIYTLSLHDALPTSGTSCLNGQRESEIARRRRLASVSRSEEHTSELQSHSDLVCRLLLEKKKTSEGQLVA